MSVPTPRGADDLQIIAAEQRQELMAAEALVSDLDFAYVLQLQEAFTASLSLHPQPSTSAAAVTQPQPDEDVSKLSDLFSHELEQELKDQAISQSEFKKLKDDLHRRLHDHRVALDISRMPDEEWEDWGDEFERPFGEGSSKAVNTEIFRVYFKGLVEEQFPEGVIMGGIGVAICDSTDDLLFELRKPLVTTGTSRKYAELRALVAGLNAALELELSRVVFYCDYYPTFKLVTGQWAAKQKKVSALVNQISHLREKFTYCQPSVVPRTDIKFVFKLAREAIISQVNKATQLNGPNIKETCVICLEETDISQIFSIDDCMHRYCFSCMRQHVEVKLLHGMLPTCPHEGCKTELKIESCSKFLTPRLIEIMSQRLKEASIPATEKVYCPFPKCSALMSKKEVLEYSRRVLVGPSERSGARKCVKCNDYFCIDCKAPWHNNMTCSDYKRRNPFPQQEEAKLKRLAATNLWRQCVKCNHMIELAAGCYHMTCRCGYEFCYTCGAEWKNKKPTCHCPLWDEDYILDDEFDEDEEEDDEDFLYSDSDDGYL
ncbi:hypothetical protein ACS0TY_014944 [Phlomoides rotata]